MKVSELLTAFSCLALLPSCAGDAGSEAASSSGGVDDPDPVITPEARAALAGLRYDSGAPPPDPSNRVADDDGARALGKRLFFDASLSGPLLDRDNDGSPGTLGEEGEAGRVSCASCHVPEAGFVDARSPHRQISLGSQWTSRRAPTLLEIAFLPLYNWDGRRDSLWNQAIGVMESPDEFNSSRLFVAQQIFELYREPYEAVFGPMPDMTVFPLLDPLQAGCILVNPETTTCSGKPGDGAEYDGLAKPDQDAVTTVMVNTAKAMGAYLRQLRCGPGRFDQWLDGDDDALSRSEQRGAALFVGAGKCVDCHSGPNLTDGKFHNVGLTPGTVATAFVDKGDRGAAVGIPLALSDALNTEGAFSDGDRGVLPDAVGPELEGAFRTPTLRCIANQPSFMHTGQHTTLDHVVNFFDRGGDESPGFPGTKEIAPLGLSEREQEDLVGFLAALQGPGPEASLLTAPGE